MTQKERQERSRHEIYCAALEEFGTQEYDRVSMEQICSRHGISKGMMYHYYSNKDELFLLCVQETFQMLREHVEREAAALDGQDASCAIKAYFVIRENFFRSRPGTSVFLRRRCSGRLSIWRIKSKRCISPCDHSTINFWIVWWHKCPSGQD